MAVAYANKVIALWVVMRPQHWVKNAFVLAPLLFSGQFTQLGACLKAGLAFVSLCGVSSAIYAINDLCDRNEDLGHPEKKLRPIACGAVGPAPAILLSMVLIILSLCG